MRNFVISSGHGQYVRGASGYLDEVDEARRVVERVADYLRMANCSVLTFHDNVSRSQSENLSRIVDFHNSKDRELDISVHFNAYQTTTKPMGTECLYVTQQELAAVVADYIAVSSGLIDRGPKHRTDLYFLNNTEAPAILIETCFVDSQADAATYNANFDTIARAIASAVSGEPLLPERPEDLPPIGEIPPGADLEIWNENIICTVFGGAEDPNNSAYPPNEYIDDTVRGCALPWKFPSGPRPQVIAINVDNGLAVVCDIVDVGPWNTNDPYWQTDSRPQAEGGTDLSGRETNGAGIDLTPGAADAIQLIGKGKVDWAFIQDFAPTDD